MEKVSFIIFEPEKETFRLTPTWISLILIGMTCLIIWVFNDISHVFVSIFALVAGLTIAYFGFSSMFSYSPLNGTLNKELAFEGDNIIIDDKIFKLEDINNLDFKIIDYYGETRGYKRGLEPRLSQGVRNTFSFTDTNNKTQTVYFKLESNNHYQLLLPFIDKTRKLGKTAPGKVECLFGIDTPLF